MAQCDKMLDSGERCSNQAVPGTQFCQTHTPRITFRRVEKPAEQAPPASTAETKTQPPPAWQAVAGPAGQAPAFPGLRPDERGILVGPAGLIWLPAEADGSPANQFNRLVRLLSFLSQALSLPHQLSLSRQGEAGDVLLQLTPDETQQPNLSVFYDIASAAARLVEGRIYVGQNNQFVQYRDETAPHGYDVPGFEASSDHKELLLVARWGSRLLNPAEFRELALAEVCEQVAPLPDAAGSAPEQVYALVPAALYPMLARYFRAHHLSYHLARLQAPAGELILFEIAPRPQAPTGRTVPRFILDYLTRLPRVAVLEMAYQAASRQILRQWHWRYPLHLPHIAEAFGPEEMVLLIGEPYGNLRLEPAPAFFDGNELMAVHAPRPEVLKLKPRRTKKLSDLELPVVLRPDHGPTPPVAAVVLTAQELAWLRPLLYRLPGEAFGSYRLCQGRNRAVLLGGDRPITGLPFGQPLRRLGDTQLFIPLRSRLVPELPWSLLHQALTIKEGVYTLITPDYRLDLRETDFVPLSRALVADTNRPRVKLNLRPDTGLPDLEWHGSAAATTGVDLTDSSISDTTTTGKPQKDRKAKITEMPFQIGKAAPSAEMGMGQQDPVDPVDFTTHLREQAQSYEAAQDFLAAALCYDLLDDKGNSARCYRQAAASANPPKQR